jgi:hypothetical protein
VTNLQKSTYQKQVPLDTLAQPRKIGVKKGKKDDLTPLQRKAKAKYITQAKACALVSYAESVGHKVMETYFWNGFHCCAEIYQEGKKITSKYCKTRICINCSRIKTAIAINRDMPIIEKWNEPTFTTLTKRTVSAESLKSEIDLRTKALYKIRDRLRKRGFSLIGIIKLEVEYNNETDKYHPHFHILHESHEYGKMLIDEWVKEFPNETNIKAQDTRKSDQNSLLEVFKYSVKLLSKDKREVNIQSLFHIYATLRNKRTLFHCGWPKQVNEIENEEMPELISQQYDIEEQNEIYLWNGTDWKGITNDKLLSGFVPPKSTQEIKNKIEKCDNAKTATLNLHLKMSKQNIAQRSVKRKPSTSEKLPSIPTSNNPINPFLTREWIELTNNT